MLITFCIGLSANESKSTSSVFIALFECNSTLFLELICPSQPTQLIISANANSKFLEEYLAFFVLMLFV